VKKNLIIGTATGYKYDDIKHFIKSLKNINYTGDVVLLVDERIDIETKNELLQQGIVLIYAKNNLLAFSKMYSRSRLWKIHYLPQKLLFKILNIGRDNLSSLNKYVKLFHLISGSRYCYYYDYLLINKDKYNMGLLTDVRDVVFQADPFSADGKDNLLNFYEEGQSIGNSFYTSYWIKHAFGSKALIPIKDKPSICSGTTIGSVDQILFYLENMIKGLSKAIPGITGLGGFDQGVHNYLIYNNSFPNSNIIRNAGGEVITLGDFPLININDNLEIVNHTGSIIPVVHQFDRLPDLKLKVLA
jgi:hypothetical protein